MKQLFREEIALIGMFMCGSTSGVINSQLGIFSVTSVVLGGVCYGVFRFIYWIKN